MVLALWSVLDLVEAAVRTNQRTEAIAQAMQRAKPGLAILSPRLALVSLGAAGIATNRQIGERLYMSHRTVGAHLYRVFPKLGISSRAVFRDALGALPPPAKPSHVHKGLSRERWLVAFGPAAADHRTR
jgi:DNA-binding CsgD family transcriptional regulator